MAVGRMIINFQALEFDVARLTWIMSFPDSYEGQLKTVGKPFSKLCDLLEASFQKQVKDSDLLGTFDNLILRIRTVNTNRNRIVHSWWFGKGSRFKTARDGKDDSEKIDVNELASSIHFLIADLGKFIDELYDAGLIRKKPGISLASLKAAKRQEHAEVRQQKKRARQ